MTNTVKFRVAICGGGIGGLCLAVALSRYPDIRVDVYEAADQFREAGAGFGIWYKSWRILGLLGLSTALSKISSAPPRDIGFDFRRSDRPSEGFRFALFEPRYGFAPYHRAHFLDVLVNHLPRDAAHLRKRLVSYTQNISDGQVHLHFKDDTKATCDVLVGCDGIKSMVRRQMLRNMAEDGHPEYLELIDPVFSGTVAYRGLIPVEQLEDTHRTLHYPMLYCGKNKHIVAFTVSQGNTVNVVAFASQPELEGTAYPSEWVTEVPQTEMLDCYANWEPEVESLLKRITRPSRWAINQLKQLPNYVTDQVALLGDAAHAMTPHQGGGATNAIEDAYILAELLGNPKTTKETLAHALKAYEHSRLPKTRRVLQGSRDSGRMYEFNGPQGDDYEAIGPEIKTQWDWMWESTPEEDAEDAIAWMESRLVCENVVQ